MQKRKRTLTLILLLIGFTLTAQTTDIARLEYLYLPQANSGNEITRFRALAQIPIPLGDKDKKNNMAVVGLEYRNTSISITDATPFNTSPLDNLHRIEGYLGYVFRLNETWHMGVKGGARINSNLEGDILSDDIIYQGAIYAINDRKDDDIDKPYRLILGLHYSTTPGRNYPLPMINYYREFRPNWTFTLGVPKTNIRHYLNNDHKDAIQAFATLDNFFSNIQNNIIVDGRTAENISMTIVMGGLGYEHYFTENLLFFAYAAHSISNDFRLRDNERNDIYTINEKNTFYFRSGVKFKF